MGALVLGLVAGVVCLMFCTAVKNALGYDDSLDVFGVHCIGGILGALATGILVNPALGGSGVMDYVAGKVGDYDFSRAGSAQRRRQPMFAEIDRGAPQDAAGAINAQTGAAVSIEEGQPKLSVMRVDAALTDARDRSRPHQRRQVGRRNV